MYFFFFCILDWIITQWMKNWNRHDLASWMDIIHIRLTVGWDGMRFGWILYGAYIIKRIKDVKKYENENNETVRNTFKRKFRIRKGIIGWKKGSISFKDSQLAGFSSEKKRWQIHYKDSKRSFHSFLFRDYQQKESNSNRVIAVLSRWWTKNKKKTKAI